METLVFGLYQNRATADAAIELLERHGYPREGSTITEHVGDIADQDVRGVATRSRSYALLGGLMTATIGAVLGAIIGYFLDVSPLATAVVGAIAAGGLGALLSTLAGSAIPRPEAEWLMKEVERGRVLVVVEVQDKQAATIVRKKLAEAGAIRAGKLSGIGAKPTLQALRPKRA